MYMCIYLYSSICQRVGYLSEQLVLNIDVLEVSKPSRAAFKCTDNGQISIMEHIQWAPFRLRSLDNAERGA